MAYVIEDRVAETSTTTGTGNLTLAGAITGFVAFDDVMANGDTCHYVIEAVDVNGVPTGEWETGLGTFNDTDTLVRTTVHKSSNAGALVNFSAGTKRVCLAVTATSVSRLALIDYFVFTGSESTITFSSIPGIYRDLVLVFNGRSDRAGQTLSTAAIRLNGDTTAANYYTQTINASNATINTNANAGTLGYMLGLSIPAANAVSGYINIIEAVISQYAGTTFHKFAFADAFHASAASAAGHTEFRSGGHWLSTSAVTSLTFFDTNLANFTTGSTVHIYGRG